MSAVANDGPLGSPVAENRDISRSLPEAPENPTGFDVARVREADRKEQAQWVHERAAEMTSTCLALWQRQGVKWAFELDDCVVGILAPNPEREVERLQRVSLPCINLNTFATVSIAAAWERIHWRLLAGEIPAVSWVRTFTWPGAEDADAGQDEMAAGLN